MTNPGIGHNSGLVPFDTERGLNEFKNDMAIVLLSVDSWSKATVTEKSEPVLQTAIDQARDVYKRLDDARKEAKKPFQDEAKRIEDFFRNSLKEMEDAGKALKGIGNAYLDEKEAKLQREYAAKARKQQKEAEQKAAEAQKAEAKVAAKDRRMRVNEARDIIDKRRAADKAAAEAAKTEKEANANQRASISGGFGRAMSQRRRRSCKITDYEAAFFSFCTDEKIRKLLVQLANQKANSKGFDPGKGIDGFEITETRSL